jgi:hypothetical protein
MPLPYYLLLNVISQAAEVIFITAAGEAMLLIHSMNLKRGIYQPDVKVNFADHVVVDIFNR